MHLRYSLQLTISTLFIIIISVLGFLLIYQGFNKTSEVMLSSMNELYEHIPDELNLDIKATYGPVSGALQHLRLSPLVQSENFSERLQSLPVLKAMLVSAPSAASVGIAYGDGDYFSVMLINSEIMRKQYQVPADAVLMVRYLNQAQNESGFKNGRIYNIFYDESLNEIKRSRTQAEGFDPRLRPWYQPLKNQAIGQSIRTPPYVFFDSGVLGLTLSVKAAEGVVIAFDITLKNLSQTIEKYSSTPGSEIVLMNVAGKVVAYKNLQKLIAKQQRNVKQKADQTSLELVSFGLLGSGVLSHLDGRIEIKPQALDFEYQSKHWIGSLSSINQQRDLFVLMLSPVDELLQEALIIRDQQSITAFFILLLFVPVIWITARKISTPLNSLACEAEAISHFNFNATEQKKSIIKEVADLDTAMELMKSTINKFIVLINSLAGEENIDELIKKITSETMLISHSDSALIYFMDEKDESLTANFICNSKSENKSLDQLLKLSFKDVNELLEGDDTCKSRIVTFKKGQANKLEPLLDILLVDELSAVIMPLQNRENEIIGLLVLTFQQSQLLNQPGNIEFAEALSGFAAVTLESRQMLKMQEALLHSFIKLIAGAIDAKSPYTGGHCLRVPEITLMLAKAACLSTEGKYRDFELSDKQWEELSIACWLHDCGKVTTPEYVVDKSTKLETIYDRIHEVRMRFEVLKRDAEITCWQQISEGEDKEKSLKLLADIQAGLDDDFAFIAECNLGGEFMADDKIERLQALAEKTWQRTLDDKLGVSWEELNRKKNNIRSLPVEEKLLSNKPEHLIARDEADKMPKDNQWGFKVDTPEYKYNRGELYNLSVKKGTLSEEERYMINGHMIQTIIMLNNLPYPKSLRNVPLIAGSHHETMDGKGYPKKLVMTEQPETARMMVIADIFEALTASDRPYKKAKTLSESIRILSFMRDDKHIDADLFDLFLSSGVYLEYANKFLSASQIDQLDINDYLS